MRRRTSWLVGIAAFLFVLRADAHPRVGVGVGAGLPDGASVSLVVRPFSWAEVQLGGATNGVSPGVRGGFTLFPFDGAFGASFEVGRYLPGDANELARMVTGDPTLDESVLEDVRYDWASVHLGFQAGSARVKLVIQGGVSFIDAHLGEPEPASGDVRLRGIVPSGRLGLVWYLN